MKFLTSTIALGYSATVMGSIMQPMKALNNGKAGKLSYEWVPLRLRISI